MKKMTLSKEVLHTLLLQRSIASGAQTYQDDSNQAIIDNFGSKFRYICISPLTLILPYEPIFCYIPTFQGLPVVEKDVLASRKQFSIVCPAEKARAGAYFWM
jgi:hypothetical protein